jgi:hypothetical protein
MITAEIKMGTDYVTMCADKTIEGVLIKIKDLHTMSQFERDHYSGKGKLDKELKTGWYVRKPSLVDNTTDLVKMLRRVTHPNADDTDLEDALELLKRYG